MFFIVVSLFGLMIFYFVTTVTSTSMGFLFRFLIILFIGLLLFRLPFGVGAFRLYSTCSLLYRLPCLASSKLHQDHILNVILAASTTTEGFT